MKKFDDRVDDNIITISPKNIIDIVYPTSDFVIVREVPFLGRRFQLATLAYNPELIKKNQLKDGENSEYKELLSDKGLSKEYVDVLINRNKSLETKLTIKFQLPFCKHYRILKEGKIKRKDYQIVNHERLEIDFTTSYSYHLIDPLKFLKMYMNRKNLRPEDNVWDVIQEDISVILGKRLIEYFTNCDYLTLNNEYASRNFEKVLLPAKSEILYDYGIYIDDVFIENFKLPDKIVDASAHISSEALRKEAQLSVADLEGQIDTISIAAKAKAERQKLLEDINSLGGPENYERIIRAKNLTTLINVGGGNEPYLPFNTTRSNGNIQDTPTDIYMEMQKELYNRGFCNSDGKLSKYAQNYLEYLTGKRCCSVYEINRIQFEKLKGHLDLLESLPDEDALAEMDNISYKLSLNKQL